MNVCGAIPPYNEILGGKLVALLATSPQVIHDYKERYADKASEIASRLKGMPVCRPADLVYVGTTSLYYVGSSQYNRLKMPGSIFNTDFDIVWKKLGMTIGFGTMHISKATTMSLTEATSDGFNRINHVFGEGASPKMRLLTMSIRELLESTNEDSKDFSKHAMSRIVYGACLAENTFDYLLGKESKPKYYTDMADYVSGTQKIIDFWRNRWLKSRLNYEPIFEESERRGRLLAEARVANIVEYNKKVAEKLAPIVVVIDEFADLADQLETTKEKNAFYKPVQRIAQAGRSRGIHLVICTQRPEAKLVPSTTKAQLNGRVALRVNDGISSRMIIEEPDAQYLQKHGDMIYRNGDIIERAQGYLIEIEELDKIVDDVIHGRI